MEVELMLIQQDIIVLIIVVHQLNQNQLYLVFHYKKLWKNKE